MHKKQGEKIVGTPVKAVKIWNRQLKKKKALCYFLNLGVKVTLKCKQQNITTIFYGSHDLQQKIVLQLDMQWKHACLLFQIRALVYVPLFRG